MRDFLKIFRSAEGQGNIGYDDAPTTVPAAPITNADNLLTKVGSTVEFGQVPGTLGNPGALIHDTEAPLNGFSLLFDLIGKLAGKHLIFKYDPAAAALFEPYFEFQDSAGTKIATLRIDPTGLGIYLGLNNGTTAIGRQNVSIGDNTMLGVTTMRDSIAIGAQALLGAGLVNAVEKVVAIGADCMDIGAGFDIKSYGVFIGANSGDSGARNVGLNNTWVGSFINNGALVLVGDTGDFCIFLGSQIATGGGCTNLTIIGNAITSLLSNLVLLGRFDQNVVIGAALSAETDDGNKLQVRGNFDSKGISQPIRTTATAAETFGANDYTILCDTTAGNITVTIDPTTRVGKIGNVKKISADINSVTLTAASGLIFDIGAGVASVSFNTQGENLQFQSDGTNIYIL